MHYITDWLNKEQEVKLRLEEDYKRKHRKQHKNQLSKAIAKQDLDFVKMRDSGKKNLHPKMFQKTANIC